MRGWWVERVEISWVCVVLLVGCVRRGEGQSDERIQCGVRPGVVDRMVDCICSGSSNNRRITPFFSYTYPPSIN